LPAGILNRAAKDFNCGPVFIPRFLADRFCATKFVAGAHSMPAIPVQQVSPYIRRLLSSRRVADRYGIHLGSVARWVARKVIPPPDQTINGRHYWFVETLEAADRERARGHAGKKQPASDKQAPTPT
jgi:hypothetical protein